MVEEGAAGAPDIPGYCRAIVDSSPMPMVIVAGKTHIIRHANRAFCLLVEKAESALTGELFSNAAPAGEECLALLDRVSLTGQAETHTGGGDGFSSGPFYWSYVMWPVLAAEAGILGVVVQVGETTPFHDRAVRMNQALMIGSVRQHELTSAAETLNRQLQEEIVQRKRAEAELQVQQSEIRTSELRYRGLIESIPQIIWTATPDGVVNFADSKSFRQLGTDLEAFNEKGWAGLLHPDDRERSLAAWHDGLESKSSFQIEHRLKVGPGGSFRWHLSRATPMGAVDGSVDKWFGTSTDVEDQKRAQLAVFDKQKLDSLGVMAGGIAHDFNNLLCAILGNASIVASGLPASHALQPMLGDIASAGERAAHLTRQMLAYAGKGRFLIERVDIADLVRSTCALIKASIPKSVRVAVETGANLPPVDADPGQMQQVVMNLILNAAEAIDASSGGWLTVKVNLEKRGADTPEEGRLPARYLAPGNYVVVEVRDNGSGMDMATQARIFDPFFTTKFTGRGLGLAAVEGILRSLGGAIDVESALGIGTTFRVFLPASRGAASAPLINPANKNAAGKQGESTILVVDDDAMIRRVAKLSLENGGFNVLVADGGEEAMRILLSKPEPRISLVILDLSMPIMSGKEVMRQMRGAGIQIPVLIASGYSEREVFAEFSDLDIVGCLQKPFTSRQLADHVSGILYPERQRQRQVG